MKVILLKDLKNYGKKDQLVEVSDGYGQNYLIPKGIAVPATRDNLNSVERNKKHRLEQEILEINSLNSLKERIEALTLNYKLNENNGKITGSISLAHIVENLKKEFNIVIDKRKFLKHEVLNKIGLFYLKIDLGKKIIATLKVNVERV